MHDRKIHILLVISALIIDFIVGSTSCMIEGINYYLPYRNAVSLYILQTITIIIMMIPAYLICRKNNFNKILSCCSRGICSFLFRIIIFFICISYIALIFAVLGVWTFGINVDLTGTSSDYFTSVGYAVVGITIRLIVFSLYYYIMNKCLDDESHSIIT